MILERSFLMLFLGGTFFFPELLGVSWDCVFNFFRATEKAKNAST